MHSAIVATALLALGVSARKHCMSAAQAQQVATNFGNLIAHYSDALADAALSPNFKDYSESVNSLINNCPQPGAGMVDLLAPTFDSRAEFKAGQGSQPAINFNQLKIWPACNSVTIRWKTTNAANITHPLPVVGIIVAETRPAPAGSKYPWLIDTIYSEFDAAAWTSSLETAGVCPGGCAPARRRFMRKALGV